MVSIVTVGILAVYFSDDASTRTMKLQAHQSNIIYSQLLFDHGEDLAEKCLWFGAEKGTDDISKGTWKDPSLPGAVRNTQVPNRTDFEAKFAAGVSNSIKSCAKRSGVKRSDVNLTRKTDVKTSELSNITSPESWRSPQSWKVPVAFNLSDNSFKIITEYSQHLEMEEKPKLTIDRNSFTHQQEFDKRVGLLYEEMREIVSEINRTNKDTVECYVKSCGDYPSRQDIEEQCRKKYRNELTDELKSAIDSSMFEIEKIECTGAVLDSVLDFSSGVKSECCDIPTCELNGCGNCSAEDYSNYFSCFGRSKDCGCSDGKTYYNNTSESGTQCLTENCGEDCAVIDNPVNGECCEEYGCSRCMVKTVDDCGCDGYRHWNRTTFAIDRATVHISLKDTESKIWTERGNEDLVFERDYTFPFIDIECETNDDCEAEMLCNDQGQCVDCLGPGEDCVNNADCCNTDCSGTCGGVD